MNKVKIGKILKAAFPTLVLTGIGKLLGHQLIMIIVGVGIALEYRLVHGKWWDKDKQICHGKFGVALLLQRGTALPW